MVVSVGAVPQSSTSTRPGVDVLRCEGLTRRFGDRVAVDGVSFSIGAGETYGLLGPNGAGKTTTIKMICGLLRANAGLIEVAGTRLDGHDVRVHARIGYVPQDLALYPDLTARENLAFFGRLYRLRGRLLKERTDEVLALVELSDRADERVESFSGGMQRRLNIGAALLHRPSLLVLDEPTAGVDPQSRHAILTSIEQFGASGMAILYTTHYMEEADRICNRVGIMDRGHLIAQGSRRELVAFVAEHDRVELTATGDREAFRDACLGIDGISAATLDGESLHLLAENGRKLLPAVLEAADRVGVAINSVEVVEPDLEAVFLHLTGTALRD
ncbi:MAG TPA: ABC transporter ATP-binding protein [Acidimicrobiia bacterium]|nr:ABC transporter ATP-binding protein [Acidimicrobiia bacterium]